MATVADDPRTLLEGSPGDPADVSPTQEPAPRFGRWWWWVIGIVVALLVAWTSWLGRQSGSDVPPAPKAFCKAAARYEKELGRQQVAYKRDVDRQILFVEDIAATAPKAVRADADVFLDSLRRLQAAPNQKAEDELKDDPDIERAVENVNRYWNQGCGVFDRQSGL